MFDSNENNESSPDTADYFPFHFDVSFSNSLEHHPHMLEYCKLMRR